MISPEECEEREWIIPNGIGGYASSTVCGINARTYHGYLIVPLNPPHKRYLFLSKFEDFFLLDGKEYPMSTNRYNFDVYYPEGYKYIARTTFGENFVTWVYDFDGNEVRKTLVVNRGSDSITVEYSSKSGGFRICPLITFRSHHLALKSRQGFFSYSNSGNRIAVFLDEKPILNFQVSGNFKVERTEYWYYNFFYKLDYERGSNYLEDLYNPFCITSEGNEVTIDVYVSSLKRCGKVYLRKDVLKLLASSGKGFVVKGKEWAIIAGYHWFDEWGRDTFVSLEGLLLLNGGYDIAKEIILRYLTYEEKGLLPNNFLHNGEPQYKGVDVSLWAINSVYKYYQYTKDKDLVKKAFPKLLDIVDWYWKGNGIVVNRNGLLFHYGAPRTWMDAQFDGTVVTPREGAAVEVNALWYNALKAVANMANEFGYKGEEFEEKAMKVKSSFLEHFVGNYGLYDYISHDMKPDDKVRPNQIFAVSLPFPVIDNPIIAKDVLKVVEEELLRPYGLSTLSRHDPSYTPYYRGDRASRDKAYHNGPIWPWLIGAYVDAKLRFEDNVVELKGLLNKFRQLLDMAERNNGHIQELFEDIPPYRPGGCISQAWSVAEVYRAVNKIIQYT